MHYGKYLEQLSERVKNTLNDLTYTYNFDVGIEFEMAIVELLQRLLPSKFGVCRGFVVASDGSEAGDDIIIYDKQRFPTLRGDTSTARKQRVPIEAVYAYIEAKNSLSATSGKKAISQISKVRKVIEKRKGVRVQDAFHPRISLSFVSNETGDGWPDNLNRLYTAIWSRSIKQGSTEILDENEIQKFMTTLKDENKKIENVDCIYVLDRHISIPIFNRSATELVIRSPFQVEENILTATQGGAIDIRAIIHLIWALDSIQLGAVNWSSALIS